MLETNNNNNTIDNNSTWEKKYIRLIHNTSQEISDCLEDNEIIETGKNIYILLYRTNR